MDEETYQSEMMARFTQLSEAEYEARQNEKGFSYPYLSFCPFCKRDMGPNEKGFNMKSDNHMDRCVHNRANQ